MTGCGSNKIAQKKYYLLEPAWETAITEHKSNALCEVADIIIAPAFASTQIVLRDNTHQIQYFGQHLWAVRPQESILQLIINYLSDRQTFKQVSNRFWHNSPNYILNTKVHQLEVVQLEKEFYAHLNIEFYVIETKTDNIIVRHRADKQVKLKQKDLNLVAKAISKLLSDELIILTNQIENSISNIENK